MKSLASSRAARHLLATSVLAQLPLGMLGIGLMVHAQRLTGSFAAAGLVTGVYAIAVGIGGPLLGRVVDRGGQIAVLLGSAGAAAALLGAAAILPAHAPAATLLLFATGIAATSRSAARAASADHCCTGSSARVGSASAPPTDSGQPGPSRTR